MWFVVVSRVHSKSHHGVGVLLTCNMWHIRLFPTNKDTDAFYLIYYMQRALIYDPAEINLPFWFIT